MTATLIDRDRLARQSTYSDPRAHAALVAEVPADLPGLAAVTRNLVVHYRADGEVFTGDRLAEINSRWVERILAVDQARNAAPLAEPRALRDRVAGCCRDFALLSVAFLRDKGIPARSRIGFAGYFVPGWHHDHVVTEMWNGERWVRADTELDPAGDWGFDPLDIPLVGDPAPPFETAAEVWRKYRAGVVDVDTYGVDPNVPIGGAWFVRNYVLYELAHLQGDELLLWDCWGAVTGELDGDLDRIDRIAELLLGVDADDDTTATELDRLYAEEPDLRPQGEVLCFMPEHEPFPVALR